MSVCIPSEYVPKLTYPQEIRGSVLFGINMKLILNKAQQENLVGNMGSVNVNIQGNLIGEESFVRDILVPEIEKARTLA